MRIAHLSAEVSPFARTGGLGDVTSALPAAQAELGHDVSVWTPLYRQSREEARLRQVALSPALPPFPLTLGYETHEIGLLRGELPGTEVPVYFVVADRFFDRPTLYHPDALGRDDGLYRYSLFVRAALEAVLRLDAVPDVFHAHDWHTALVPMVLAWDPGLAKRFSRSVTVFTIHNPAFQGIYDRSEFPRLGLPDDILPATLWHDRVNLMKGAILTADAVSAVSPTFAREIATPEGGFGLDPIFRYRGDHVVGIVNGIDPKIWDPAIDPLIPTPFSSADLCGKADARKALLERTGMNPADPGMVIGLAGRLAHQKGLDLLFGALPELLADGLRFVVLGSGEEPIESAVKAATARHPGKFFGHVGFDDPLAHLVVAGSDAFLMPSRFEPCGLTQLYALAYGTPPIVRRVGGLADTVVPYDGSNAEEATGFSFHAPSPEALRHAVRQAHRAFRHLPLWSQIVANGMAQDFGWTRSARNYLDLYAWQLLERRRKMATRAVTRP